MAWHPITIIDVPSANKMRITKSLKNSIIFSSYFSQGSLYGLVKSTCMPRTQTDRPPINRIPINAIYPIFSR
jgi:hypothetical protein